ncbi:hypothetical protein BJ741DRAFT_711180 [Chytriomyces cf. hyalinus JEL632]|nr:hypothetical protein BJ741DRAFT_711180 [Chytriomyces cf. hyalinus JEL632]
MPENPVVANLERLAETQIAAPVPVKARLLLQTSEQISTRRQYPSHPSIRVHDQATNEPHPASSSYAADDSNLTSPYGRQQRNASNSFHHRRSTAIGNPVYDGTNGSTRIILVPPVPGMSDEERRMNVVSPSAEVVDKVVQWLKRPFTPNHGTSIQPAITEPVIANPAIPQPPPVAGSFTAAPSFSTKKRGKRPPILSTAASANTQVFNSNPHPRFTLPATFFGMRPTVHQIPPKAAPQQAFTPTTAAVPSAAVSISSNSPLKPHPIQNNPPRETTYSQPTIPGPILSQPVNARRAQVAPPMHSTHSHARFVPPQKQPHQTRSSTLPTPYIPTVPPPAVLHNQYPASQPTNSIAAAAAAESSTEWQPHSENANLYRQRPSFNMPPPVQQTRPVKRYMKFRPKKAPGDDVDGESSDDGEDRVLRPCDYVDVIDTVLDFGGVAQPVKTAQPTGFFGRLGHSLIGGIDVVGSKLAGIFGITNGRYEEYYEDGERYEYEEEEVAAEAAASRELRNALRSA